MVESHAIIAQDSEGVKYKALWSKDGYLIGDYRLVDPVNLAAAAEASVTLGPVGAEREAVVDIAKLDTVLAAITQWANLSLVTAADPEPTALSDSVPRRVY